MSVPHVSNFFDALTTGVAALLITLLAFIPSLIGAIIILIIGWIISGILARVVSAALRRVGFNAAADRGGVTGFLRQTGMERPDAASVLGEIVKWFIRLIAIFMAAQALHLEAITTLITTILLWIPHLVVGLVVLMIAALLARFIGDIVRGAAGEGGFGNANALATVASGAIIGFGVLVALHEIGVAPDLVLILFGAIVGALALAFGLAFGLGGRDVASQITQNWYSQRGQASQLFQGAGRQAGSQLPGGQTGATSVGGTTADVSGTTVRARSGRGRDV